MAFSLSKKVVTFSSRPAIPRIIWGCMWNTLQSRKTYPVVGARNLHFRHVLSATHLHTNLWEPQLRSTPLFHGWGDSGSEWASDWAKVIKPWSIAPSIPPLSCPSQAQQGAKQAYSSPRKGQADPRASAWQQNSLQWVKMISLRGLHFSP